jgi:hypothetical protein
MTSLNRPARLNRWMLALFGLLLLAAGGLALAAYFGRLPWLSSTAPLVPGTSLPPTWVLIVSAVVAVLLGLFCVRWLAAQLTQRPKSTTWRLETDPARGHTVLSASIAVQPLVSEVTGYPGVHAASGTLAGSQDKPILVVTVRANQDADLAVIRRRISQDGLPRLRQALDLPALPARTEFRYTTRTGPRAL